MARCERCGTEYNKTKKSKRFCSEACRLAAERERYVRKEKYVYICAYCGHEYRTAYKERDTYCSRECAFDDKEKRCDCGKSLRGSGKQRCEECQESYVAPPRPPVFSKCDICMFTYEKAGNAFEGCCSRECMLEKNRRRFREAFVSEAKPIQCTCLICGEAFMSKTGAGAAYCSKKCYKKSDVHKAAKVRARHLRRARKHNAKYETFNPADIFKRDGYICQLCGKAIDRRVKWPHDKSPVLDHIIPLSLGGEHTRRNVQCAHNKCNTEKGASLQGQSRMFG